MSEVQTQGAPSWGDLWTRVQQQTQQAVGDVYTYYAQQGVQQIVKQGQGGGGNKTAAELAAGQTGAPPANMSPTLDISMVKSPMFLLGAGLGLVALYFVVKK